MRKATELSKFDFYAGAPKLLAKLAHYRPRVVCLVGKCIWDALHQTFLDWSLAGTTSTLVVELPDGIAIAENPPVLARAKHKSKAAADFKYGLQPYRLIHSASAGGTKLYLYPYMTFDMVLQMRP